MPKARAKRPISVAVTPSGGYWVAFYDVSTNGQPDRRKRSGRMCPNCRASSAADLESLVKAWKGGDRAEVCECHERVVDKIRDLEDKAAAKTVEKPGLSPTVREFFTFWLDVIAPVQPSATKREPLRRLTIDGYRRMCENWIFPHVGHIRLDALEDSDLDRIYAAMYAKKLQPSSVAAAHAVVKRGLSIAVRRRKVGRNVAKDMDPPGSPSKRQRKALSEDQVKKLFSVIAGEDDELRWKIGFAIGPRQGEVLAIRWQYLDLEQGVVDTSWQIQRLTWQHGCKDPLACGGAPRENRPQGYHRTRRVCPGGSVHARYHGKGCPMGPPKTVCPPKCDGHADKCPDRKDGGIVFARPKTYIDAADQHLVGLPPTLVAQLREYRKRQAALRLKVGSRWHDYDLVFCQPNGRPLEPRKDYDRWKAILRKAGLIGKGTHVQRSTAATLMFKRRQRLEVVQEVLGHKNPGTTRLYTEVDVGLTVDAALEMDDLFGSATDLATEREKRRRDEAS